MSATDPHGSGASSTRLISAHTRSADSRARPGTAARMAATAAASGSPAP